MKNKHLLTVLRSASLLGGAWLLPIAASAAMDTWVGNTSDSWSAGANWSGGTVPASGDTLVFGAPGSSGLTLVAGTFTLGGSGTDGMIFTTTAPSYTINNGTLTLGSSNSGIAIRDLSSFLQSFGSSIPFTLSGAQTIQVGETTGAVLSSLAISGQIIGGQRLTKTGNGLLILGSSSDELGGLTVNAGTVSISADAMLSATAPGDASEGWIVLDGGALRTNSWLTIHANRGIALGSAMAGSGGTLSVTVGKTYYNGVIADNGGANRLTITGGAILSLGGANTYTGETRIDQGQLTLDFTASGGPASNIICNSSALVMGGLPTVFTNLASTTYGGAVAVGAPILFVQATGKTASSQTFASLTVAPGYANLAARGNGEFNATVDLGAISHAAGGTVSFSLLTSGGTGQGIFTTTTPNTNGILGGWATTAAVTSGEAPIAATEWAANDGNGNIVAYTGYTIPTGQDPDLASSAASNIRLDGTSSGTATLASSISDLSTIQVTDTNPRVIAIGPGDTLRLGAFGGVWTAGTGALTITGGTLTAGGASDAAGEIVFNSSGAAIIVKSVIDNNSTGAVNVVKTGTAGITLSGSNTYTGGTCVNFGTLNAYAETALGTGDVTVLAGGQVWLSEATYANNFNIAGAGALVPSGATVSGKVILLGNTTIGSSRDMRGGTISGQITGDYSLAFLSGDTGTITLSHPNNTYTGATTVVGGTLAAASNTALGMGPASITGGMLNIKAGTTLKNAFTLDGGSLAVDGGVAGEASIVFGGHGGTLMGSGSVAMPVALNSTNQILSPGDSAGVLSLSANQAWSSLTYKWELNSWASGSERGACDQIAIIGSLNLTGMAHGVLSLTTLQPGNTPGLLSNFSETNQTWTILSTTGGITGFNAAAWTVDTTKFANPFKGKFSVTSDGKNISLHYIIGH